MIHLTGARVTFLGLFKGAGFKLLVNEYSYLVLFLISLCVQDVLKLDLEDDDDADFFERFLETMGQLFGQSSFPFVFDARVRVYQDVAGGPTMDAGAARAVADQFIANMNQLGVKFADGKNESGRSALARGILQTVATCRNALAGEIG